MSSDVLPNAVRSLFTPIAEKVEMVKTWPVIRSWSESERKKIDRAYAEAFRRGVFARYERGVQTNPFLDVVIDITFANVPETLNFAHTRMKTAHHGKYVEWKEAFDRSVDDDRVKLIAGARPFVPNRVTFELVDFAANWDRTDGVLATKVQAEQADRLAGFAVLYGASQNPRWVQNMDGDRVPYALASTLLVNAPGAEAWQYSPVVCNSREGVELGGGYLNAPSTSRCMPTHY